MWTEARSGVGAVNFITGAGGFLQAVLFGYGGVRLTLNTFEVMPPTRLPNKATSLILHGLKYHGGIFDLTIDNRMYHLHVRALNSGGMQPLVFEHEEARGELKVDDVLSYSTGTRLIIRPAAPLCP